MPAHPGKAKRERDLAISAKSASIPQKSDSGGFSKVTRIQERFLLAGILALAFIPMAMAQEYVFEKVFDVSGDAGGIAVLSEDVLVVSITDLGSLVKFTGDLPGEPVSTWTNPADASDTVTFVPGIDTGPRGVVLDPFGNVLTLSNDTDHNILVWNTNLEPTSKRLITGPSSGSDGRIYAIDTDDAGNLYTFRYYNVPGGRHRLEVYPPVIEWGTAHAVIPLLSLALDEPSPTDAHEGMCVSGAGSVIWYANRSDRSVHRLIGSPTDGYTEDTGFSLDLSNGSASSGFRCK